MPYSRKSRGMMTDDRVSIPALTRAIKSLAFLLYQMPAEFSCCWVTGRSNIIFKICPWLHQMINNYLQFSLLLESWSISVTGVGIHVIDKWQMPRYVCCSPVTEKWIQKSLISPCSWETKMNIILKSVIQSIGNTEHWRLVWNWPKWPTQSQGSYPFSETNFNDFSRIFLGLILIFPGLQTSP